MWSRQDSRAIDWRCKGVKCFASSLFHSPKKCDIKGAICNLVDAGVVKYWLWVGGRPDLTAQSASI